MNFEDVKLVLALVLTIIGIVLPYFKMIDNEELQKRNEETLRVAKELAKSTGEPQQYIVSTNPNFHLRRLLNWWGLFAALCFIAGVSLFFI